ncbi:hypothetical protein IHE44_0005967 [Lamprotornis superbus]|uniref:T-cell surface glycoprotein CD3 zeta chain n=1 Tax=Lamprotornis superbus TaxID=245042 RepID=A0A835TXE5_9PASS|nr:hypothetical protein IHE44_0005967 [Lamprotornis superbus]
MEDAASVLGLTDPRLCYVLDGFLFIYAVVMTALFVKAKLSQASAPQLPPGQDDVYNKLSRTPRDDYDVLGGKRRADPELGGRHQQRRKNPQDTVYTSLQKDKMGEAYSEIGMKGEQQRRRGKGHEGLYQQPRTLMMLSKCSLCPPAKDFSRQDSLFQAVKGGKLRSAPQRVLINITQPPEG